MEARSFRVDDLEVRVYPNREAMGAAAAAMAEAAIQEALSTAETAGIIFAAAPSQNEFLAGLRDCQGIDWRRIAAFHLDEYVGLSAEHPASFRRFLKSRLIARVPIRAFYQIQGDAMDLEEECGRYAEVLAEARPALAVVGIGENGHLAFIDPPVCDFTDPLDVRPVDLDAVCRNQQVHDGAFEELADVPRRALSMTIPAILRTPRIIAVVPGPAKQVAVRDALEGPIAEACPASALRRHPAATLFLDEDAAALVRR